MTYDLKARPRGAQNMLRVAASITTNAAFFRINRRNKAFRHVENLFIQRFLFIHPRFVFIVQGSLLVVQ